MVPMRDGTRLFTSVYVPYDASSKDKDPIKEESFSSLFLFVPLSGRSSSVDGLLSSPASGRDLTGLHRDEDNH